MGRALALRACGLRLGFDCDGLTHDTTSAPPRLQGAVEGLPCKVEGLCTVHLIDCWADMRAPDAAPVSQKMRTNFATLTTERFQQAIAELASRDPDLAHVLSRWGEPPFWTHQPGFPGMVISILAQQVSLESAESAFAKLENALPAVTPQEFLSLDELALKRIGFSRQKASYVRGLAQAILANEVDLDALESLDDRAARERLVALRGVGPWTADAYLLFCLRRSDAWPSADLALLKAMQELKRLPGMPTSDEGDTIAESWRPWRGAAARLLWYHYLCSRGRTSSAQQLAGAELASPDP